jgi:hypothetical protein
MITCQFVRGEKRLCGCLGSNFKKESELKAILIDTEKDGREIVAVVFDDNATRTPRVADSEMEGVTNAGRDTVGTDDKWWLILLERKYTTMREAVPVSCLIAL